MLVVMTLLMPLLSRSPAIVVATPGRLWDLVQEGNPHLSLLSQLRYLAIDETDRMVEKVLLMVLLLHPQMQIRTIAGKTIAM